MTSALSKVLGVLAVVMVVYRFRYKLMNMLLGNLLIRQLAVRISMGIPFIRRAFIQSAFRTGKGI